MDVGSASRPEFLNELKLFGLVSISSTPVLIP